MIAADQFSTQNLEPSPQQAMPERELWAAVMDRAIEDLFTIHVLHWRNRACVKREVLAWFKSIDETEGSFRFVCQVLNYDPSAARKAILRRTARDPLLIVRNGSINKAQSVHAPTRAVRENQNVDDQLFDPNGMRAQHA